MVTQMPEIDDQSSYEVDITKVVINDEYTIIYFSYQYSNRNNQNFNLPFPLPRRQQQQSSATISINPKSYLNGNGKRFKYIRATGIPELPDAKPVVAGEVYKFTVYYEKLDPGVELFNLIEGKNTPEQTLHFWNFYGVHVRNPLKPIVADLKLTIKGKILDAKTQKPITGKVVYQFDKNTKKTGSVLVNQSGDYTFTLSPDAYTLTASAQGYEPAQASLDLSKIKRSQQFTQNLYLSPVTPKPEPKPVTKVDKEPESPKTDAEIATLPKEEVAPVKVEENKFRLDKVYFNIGESGLLPASYVQLDGLLNMLKESPKMNIMIEGHTDNIGDPTQNKRLSLERAFNVREYLIGKGITGSRIQIKGYGDTKPIASNDTEEGRKQNRRVEFIILNP